MEGKKSCTIDPELRNFAEDEKEGWR